MHFNKTQYLSMLQQLVSNNGIHLNRNGLKANLTLIGEWLENLGFNIQVFEEHSDAPIMMAKRDTSGTDNTLGLYAHYDVEPTQDSQWNSDPLKLTEKEDRISGRGIADNLGIIVLRIMALQALVENSTPNLIWVFQGQEEIGSPMAHQVFPTLNIPEVDLWLEETGYFDLGSSRQRFLTLNENSIVTVAKKQLTGEINDIGFTSYTENRSLTKFDKCPFLTHLVKGVPYLAIGPNDEYANIHQPNESLSLPLVEKSFKQHLKLFSIFKNIENKVSKA